MKRAALLTLALGLGLAIAAPTPAGTQITNTAYVDVLEGPPERPVTVTTPSNPVTVTVQAVCSVSISPSRQSSTGGVGTTVPFTFTVTNTGNAAFDFPLTATPLSSATSATISPDMLHLDAQEAKSVTLNLVALNPGTNSAALTTSCTGGDVQTGTAVLETTRLPVTVTKAVNTDRAEPGQVLTYTIVVSNPNQAPVYDVTVRDVLQAELEYVTSSLPPVGTNRQELKFSVPMIPALGHETIVVQARVSLLKDDMHIENVASAFLPQDPPATTPPVVTDIWDGKLSISKDVDKRTVQVGERVNYAVTVRNTSLNAAFTQTRIVDTAPQGLNVDESSLKLNGAPVQDLNPDPQIVEVKTPPLRANESVTLTYSAVVQPFAAGQGNLRNVVYSEGVPQSTIPGLKVVKTPLADAVVTVVSPQRATLIGRVYLDRNANGTYQNGTDLPISGARILIAGLGSVLTDSQGRYGVADLREGRYGMQLQTEDLGGDPRAKGGDYKQRGARLSNVYGLTVEDFPLIPPVAELSAQRWTRVYGESVTVVKTVTPQGDDRYSVRLVFTNMGGESEIALQDVLPANLRLSSGELSAKFTLRPGESRVIEYALSGQTTPEARLTDPNITVTTY